MDIAEARMSEDDIRVILNVCVNLPESAFDELDITTVINSLKVRQVIDSERHHSLLKYYEGIRRTPRRETSINQFYSFIRSIRCYVPFFGFCDALENAGYTGLSQELILGRDKYRTAISQDTNLEREGSFVSRSVLKRELPNAQLILRFYACLKRRADNNLFGNQTYSVLSKTIDSLGSTICLCSDINRLQLLVDVRCVLYFLLCQQCSRVKERTEILKQMRDSMPRGVDRTIFDTIFHSYMAFNWALSGNVETAEKHAVQARITGSSCVPGFVYIVMALWSQYKNNILYVKSNCRTKSYINQAKSSYSIVQQCLDDIRDNDERNMWKTISILDMARSTVGIHQKLEICDISTIDKENVEYANKMLDQVDEPRDIRRKMYYFVIRGRLLENSDPHKAKIYVEKAAKLAGDGCYDETEKNNIENYLMNLERCELPRPSI